MGTNNEPIVASGEEILYALVGMLASCGEDQVRYVRTLYTIEEAARQLRENISNETPEPNPITVQSLTPSSGSPRTTPNPGDRSRPDQHS